MSFVKNSLNIKELSLSMTDTNVLKGVALFLLLFHHLFFIPNDGYDDLLIGNEYFMINTLAVGLGKFCVALFVFLSGYGLTIGSNKLGGVKCVSFYRRRIVKLMMNYWFVWLVFVPVGVFFFNRTFSEVYGEPWGIKFLGDFVGLAHAFGYRGYCSTWWFYSCIIVLYLIFPILYFIRTRWYLLIAFAVLTHFYGNSIPVFKACWPFQLVFILGILMATYKCVPVNVGLKGNIIVLSIIGLAAVLRLRESVIVTWQDVLLSYFVMVFYVNVRHFRWIQTIFTFVGHHSFNIFLFHTLLLRYYLHDYIFWTRNPLLLYLTLVVLCLGVSIVMERVKKILYFDRIQKYLIGKNE